MKINELVSVIMSTYNEDLHWIEESVESILHQSHDNLEFIIILDNPNNDELKELLLAYATKDNRVKLIVNEENKGLVKSLNIALKHCKGKYIARMDADDVSTKNRLEIQKEYLIKNGLDFVFSGVTVINEDSKYFYESNQRELSPGKTKKLLEITNCTYHPTWFIRSEVFQELKGYRDVSYCEDYDFSLRSISKGYKIGKMDENILKYRVRSNSISRNYSLEQFLNMKGILKLYKKNQLNNLDLVTRVLKDSKKRATEEAKESFKKGNIEYSEAVLLWKDNRKFRSIVKLISSCRVSKYYVIKYINMLNYKFHSNFYMIIF